MTPLPGVTSTLLPTQFLVDTLVRTGTFEGERLERRLRTWWSSVETQCGPTTGTRALFDLVAMPLFGMLGFRARTCAFESGSSRGWLETRGGAAVAFVVRPWGSSPQSRSRELIETGHAFGASWGFMLAPPVLSLVDIRGQATRRAIDFVLPAVLRGPGLHPFVTLARSSAFDRPVPGAPTPLGAIVVHAASYQDRVRRDLQYGVLSALDAWTRAIATSTGGPGHRRRPNRSRPAPPEPDAQALTLVYRVLFLLFAESRGLVPGQQPIYRSAYAMSTICHQARLADAPGAWDGLAATTRLARLGSDLRDLDVAPFNGPLFAKASAPVLETRSAALRSRRAKLEVATRQALTSLTSREGRAGREAISFRDLGVEQLGAVYERVLDAVSGPGHSVTRTPASYAHSRARKQSGAFYTPQALTEFLVRRTLAPLVSGRTPEDILALRVVDPAMGSGAFIVAACHFLAAAYERALIDAGDIDATDVNDEARAAFRRVVAERCLAGVDVNPTAVELARLSLWLTTLARGKPLSFFDHRLRIGNSLLGAWPDDLRRGGDRQPSRRQTLPLFEADPLEPTIEAVMRPLGMLLTQPDDSVQDVRRKETAWRALMTETSPLTPWRRALDLWCARWFWPASAADRPGGPEVRALLAALLNRDRSIPPAHLGDRLRDVAIAAKTHAFFHWPLEFVDIFYDADGQARRAPGFDAVIGNPPWEMLRRDSRGSPAEATSSVPERDNASFIRYIRESGAYPSCGRGHLNLYQPFLDRALALTRSGGRYGLVLPWGLAADEGAAPLRSRLLDRTSLDTLVGIDNARGLFPIHRGMRFAAVAGTQHAATVETDLICGVRTAGDLDTLPALRTGPRPRSSIRLTPRDIAVLGGDGRRFPDLRHAADVAWRLRITQQFPRLGAAGGWQASFGRELNATEARPHYSNSGLPVLEGKHIDAFVTLTPKGGSCITPTSATHLLPNRPFERPRLAYRDVSAVGNRATLIAAVIPAGTVTSHTLLCLRTPLSLEHQHFLSGILNSFVANALVRSVMASHITTTIVEALPVPHWSANRQCRLIAHLARRLSRGRPAPVTRARLQGLVASLYGLTVEEFRTILDTFPLAPVDERQRAAAVLEALAA